MLPMYEKFRPRSWEELVGQDELLSKISVIKRRGLKGRVFWLTGASGTGKTTVARLIAEDIADDYEIQEIDAQDVSMDRVREFEKLCRYTPMGGCHVLIINEAHGLSQKVVSRLLTVFEHPNTLRNSTWIFTTTFDGRDKLFGSAMDACPFMSRAIGLELAYGKDVELSFALKLREACEAEGLAGAPLEEYVRCIRNSKGNLRAAYQQAETGAFMRETEEARV